MPLTRITIGEVYQQTHCQQISQILQQTLVAEFNVPEADCFQLFEPIASENRVIHPRYLSPGRTDNFILFQVLAGKPRSHHQQQRWVSALVTQLTEQMGINGADVMVTIQYNRPCDWSFANGQLFTLEDNQ
ncbi:tautomerase family protein [Celerinatantimonas sp. YJH-8]|uniref:tautomerase family protein n=1 Tax=Celerinatantimonas sp. YJH-8 TaxID=3228714 RepID=UPI0038C6DAE2